MPTIDRAVKQSRSKSSAFPAAGETITLSVAGDNEVEITDSVIINGLGANRVIVSANDNSRVLLIDNDDDNTEIDVTLRGLTIRDGNTSLNGQSQIRSLPGAGIQNSENLTLENVSVLSNRSDPNSFIAPDRGNSGGGLSHRIGELQITGSTFADNSALNGGGISISSGSAEINNSTFTGNAVRNLGGAISINASSSTVTIRNSTITGNRANDDDDNSSGGGGISSGSTVLGATLTLHNTLVAGNFNGTGEEIDDISGPISSDSSHNLIGERDAGVSLNNGTNGNIVGDGNGGDLPIGSIFDQIGGAFVLAANSPAVNAGSNAEAIDFNGNNLLTDQFGEVRVQFGTVDIGAQESSFDTPREQPSLIVTTTLDEVDDSDFETSLREAITFANNTQGDATITFDIGLTGETITLDGSQIEVTDSVTIQGLGANQLTISGNDASRVFLIDDDNDNTEINVTLRGLTIRDGNTTSGSANFGRGAGIQNTENLTLEDVAVRSNRSDLGGRRGGGLAHSLGDLVVTASTFADNSSLDSGGIDIASGSVEIVNSTFYGNTVRGNGAAIRVEGDDTTVTIRNSTITGNTADDNNNQANQAGGIQRVGGTVTLHNTLVAGNFGGTDGEINDLAGTFSAASSHNLIGEQDSGVTLNNGTNGNIVGDGSGGALPIDAILTAQATSVPGLEDTLEFFLTENSLAINAGSNDQAVDTFGAELVTDQFGNNRIQFETVDIGSRESALDLRETPSLTVTTISDVVDGSDFETSLREAINFANSTPGLDTITFTADLAGETITLDGSQLEITESVTIEGLGVDQLTISGNDASRVFVIDDDNDNTEIDVTLRGLTIRDGNTTSGSASIGRGAGIQNKENLTLEDVAVRSNRSDIVNGSLSSRGGGLAHSLGELVVTASTFADNSSLDSGGIDIASGSVEIVNSTFYGNTVRGNGAAIRVEGDDTTVTIRNSTITGNIGDDNDNGNNQAGGIQSSSGTVTLHNTLVAGNFGGTDGEINDLAGAFSSDSSNNLIGEQDSGVSLNNGTNGNIVGDGSSGALPIDSILTAQATSVPGLEDTLEFFLTENSLAINAGSNDQAVDIFGEELVTDQFGNNRIQFETVDIGSRESALDLRETPSLTVTTISDVVDGSDFETSLREAINFANSTPGLDTITFTADLAGETITLDGTELEVTDSVTIQGLGANQLTISGNDASRVFLIDDDNDNTEINVTLRGLTIRDGNTTSGSANFGRGAGIQNTENLTLEDVAVRSNRSDLGGRRGGGLAHSLGDLVVTASTFADNSSLDSGGIDIASGSVEIVNSTFYGNTVRGNGAAIRVEGDDTTVTIRNSTITGNTADDNNNQANQAGGIQRVGGTVTLHNTLVAGNFGGTDGEINDLAGTFSAASSHNLIGEQDSGVSLNNGTNGNIVGDGSSGALPIDSILTAQATSVPGLEDTLEFFLTENSLAINAGSNDQAVDIFGEELVTDQFGNNRIQFETVDIGSRESALDLRETPSLTVTTISDVVDGSDFETSLREAINFANSTPGLDTITFTADLAGETITLDGTELEVTDSVTIQGLGANQLTISGNDASRIFSFGSDDDATYTITDVTLTDGEVARGDEPSPQTGGAIFLNNPGDTLIIERSVISSSAANGGGAIRISGDGAVLQISDSALIDNEANFSGSAVLANGSVTTTIVNSTVSGNTSLNNSSTLIVQTIGTQSGELTLRNVTVNDNNGSGLLAFTADSGGTSAITVGNSIVAGNTGPNLASQGPGSSFTSFGNNIFDDASVTPVLDSDQVDTDPLLGPLGDNGGPTPTHALLSGSLAINRGNNALALNIDNSVLTTDQRGETFDRIQFDTVDIGAFESNTETPSLIVTTASDVSDESDSETSLREAINFANSVSGDATITFENNLAGATITLGGSQLEISDSVTIDGLGVDQLTISGNDASRVFLIDDDNDNTEIDVTIRGLTIRDGNTTSGSSASTGTGAGIQNKENLTLDDVAVRSNRSDLVTGSAGSRGGGLAHSLGDLVVTASTFADNSSLDGGGIDAASGSVEIVNSTFYGNTVRGEGAAIRVAGSDTTVTIRNSTITGNIGDDNDNQANQAGGIQRLGGSVTLHNTLVAGNFGGTDGEINDLAGTFSSDSSHNLIGEQDSGVTLNNGTNGNIVGDGSGGALPLASILTEEVTSTGFEDTSEFFLIANSPAVNAGSNAQAVDAVGEDLLFDQFGNDRIRFGTVDIGSRESGFDAEIPSLIVTTTSDDVDGSDIETSLREAINFANSTPGPDTITFAADLAGQTLTLGGSQIEVTDSITIQGLGADQLTISGAELSRIFLFGSADDATYTIADVTLTDGEVARPQTGGAIFLNNPGDTLIIERSVISSSAANGGGAVSVMGDGAELRISDSALINNEANFNGSAVLADGSVTTTIVNSTVSGNTSLNNFSTLVVQASGTQSGELTLRNVTVNDNTGNGLGVVTFESGGTSSITVGNSIVAGSSGANLDTFGSGSSFTSLGNNIFDDASVTPVLDSDQVDTDPLLGSLADNGGPTLTHRLLPGSQAIDAGNNALAVDADGNLLLTDQRGSGFERIIDGNADDTATVDIGAFEAPFSGDLLVSTDTDISDGNFGTNELSLREAIEIANERSGADTITFASNVFTGGDNSVIRLTQGELVITDSLSIDGSSVSDVVITGDASNDDIRVSGTNITDVAASFGETAGDSDDLLDDNSRVLNFSGSTGYLTLSGLTITGGRTTSNFEAGGGIRFDSDGALSLLQSTISGNSSAFGGGIVTDSGSVSLSNSTISGNSSTYGGGILTNYGAVSLSNSTLSGNSSGADGGGIFTFLGSVSLSNSTITGNSASGEGGGIGLRADDFNDGGRLTLHNSIVAGNTDDGTAPDVLAVGDVANDLIVENSLIGNTTGSGITSATGTGNILNQSALLGSLADNGGPTLTHALLPGSQAINAGNNDLALDIDNVVLTTDQRGETFDRIRFGTVDIGAFESSFVAEAAPVVTGIKVGSPDWNSDFVSAIDADGEGFSLEFGSGQLDDVSFVNATQLFITFDKPVTGLDGAPLAPDDFSLIGSSTLGNSYNILSVDFLTDTNTAVLTLDAPLTRDKLLLTIGEGKIFGAGGTLDGEFETGVSLASGDGKAGGDFNFRFDVLPGNVNNDQLTNTNDLSTVRSLGFQIAGVSAEFNARANVNGDRVVNTNDISTIRGLGTQFLVNLAEPEAPTASGVRFEPATFSAASSSAVLTDAVSEPATDVSMTSNIEIPKSNETAPVENNDVEVATVSQLTNVKTQTPQSASDLASASPLSLPIEASELAAVDWVVTGLNLTSSIDGNPAESSVVTVDPRSSIAADPEEDATLARRPLLTQNSDNLEAQNEVHDAYPTNDFSVESSFSTAAELFDAHPESLDELFNFQLEEDLLGLF